MSASPLYLTAQQPFEAAREWPRGRMHGHGFLARLAVPESIRPGAFRGEYPQALSRRLAEAVEPLDYSLLNDLLDGPDDRAVAEWLRNRLDCEHATLWLQSAPGRGVVVGPDERLAWRRFRFEAAHRLPNVPAGHKCGRMHGHGFEVVLEARTENGDEEDRLASAWRPLHERLHLACLNDFEGLDNPTSEILAAWIWDRLRPGLRELAAVSVMETASAGCRFDGRRWQIWKSQSFDSAVKLAGAPAGHALGRLHGHTFETRLHLSGELDAVLGWVEDYGDIKRRFDPTFRALDHRPLHQDGALEDCDAAGLAGHIAAEMHGSLPDLSRVDVLETPGCGAIVVLGTSGAAPTGLLRP